MLTLGDLGVILSHFVEFKRKDSFNGEKFKYFLQFFGLSNLDCRFFGQIPYL